MSIFARSRYQVALLSIAIASGYALPAMADQRQDASQFTVQANNSVLNELPFADRQDFEDALRGRIAPVPDESIRNAAGQSVWNPAQFRFLDAGTCPPTVNPSLWRQSRLTAISGLFKVCDRIYQVRNFDLSNMTIIEGDVGLIIVDPLISMETARAALELYYRHRPRKPVLHVIYSHSHTDHYGGVKGVVAESDVKSGKVKIFAPAGFLEHAVSENVLAGNAMSRRALYMYGMVLPADEKGQVGSGLGTTTSVGTITIIPPTDTINGATAKNIDGLTFEFMLAPATEAPSEMHWFIPELKALTCAENCTHNMHNIYTLRGAQIRDALMWSRALHKTLNTWGDKAEVMYGMHHWPVWGSARIKKMIGDERDLYKFINDQTLRLANHGYSMTEIAEMIKLPKSLASSWYNRGYYGSLNHNVKATYVKYLGYFDGNPATLHELPPEEASKKYVEFMGGVDQSLQKARAAFERGEYRWVAQVVNHIVFADPANEAARKLQADCLEQLGYQCESGPWRNFYLTGAKELRDGIISLNAATAGDEVLDSLPTDLLLDYLAVRLNAPKAEGQTIKINLTLPDKKERFALLVENCVLNYTSGTAISDADTDVTINRAVLNEILSRKKSWDDCLKDKTAEIKGDKAKLNQLFALLDSFRSDFPIVTP